MNDVGVMDVVHPEQVMSLYCNCPSTTYFKTENHLVTKIEKPLNDHILLHFGPPFLCDIFPLSMLSHNRQNVSKGQILFVIMHSETEILAQNGWCIVNVLNGKNPTNIIRKNNKDKFNSHIQ